MLREKNNDNFVKTPQVNGAPPWFRDWMMMYHLPLTREVKRNGKMLWIIMGAAIASMVMIITEAVSHHNIIG